MKSGVVKLIICIFLFQSCVNLKLFENWNIIDKNLYKSWVILHGVDTLQTKEIFENPNYYELNPVFKRVGKTGTMVIMLAEYPAIYYLTNKYQKFRTPSLIGLNIISGILVYHNNSIGVTISTPF